MYIYASLAPSQDAEQSVAALEAALRKERTDHTTHRNKAAAESTAAQTRYEALEKELSDTQSELRRVRMQFDAAEAKHAKSSGGGGGGGSFLVRRMSARSEARAAEDAKLVALKVRQAAGDLSEEEAAELERMEREAELRRKEAAGELTEEEKAELARLEAEVLRRPPPPCV